MIDPFTFRFTSVPLPRIIETHPADGDNDAPSRTNFNIFFNTPINPGTVMRHVEMIPPLPITRTRRVHVCPPWTATRRFHFLKILRCVAPRSD